MPFHIYKVCNDGQPPQWFGIHVEFDEDRWVSRCAAVDAGGNELCGTGSVAPRFYGMTAEQALRRMIESLENTFDEVSAARPAEDR